MTATEKLDATLREVTTVTVEPTAPVASTAIIAAVEPSFVEISGVPVTGVVEAGARAGRPASAVFWLLLPAVAAIITLDVHTHRCHACGWQWMHAGLFAAGYEHDPAIRARRCRCGARQWSRAR